MTSISTPASFAPSASRSFGHFRPTLLTPAACSARNTPIPAASDSPPSAADTTHSLQLLATGTGDAIASGSVYAAAAAIEQIGKQMLAQCKQEPRLLLTGGDALRVLPLLGIACKHDPGLVLKGLAILSGDG